MKFPAMNRRGALFDFKGILEVRGCSCLLEVHLYLNTLRNSLALLSSRWDPGLTHNYQVLMLSTIKVIVVLQDQSKVETHINMCS